MVWLLHQKVGGGIGVGDNTLVLRTLVTVTPDIG